MLMTRSGATFAGDLPAAVGAVRTRGRFHVLTGDQRQQGHHLGGGGVQIPFAHDGEQRKRIADQRIDQHSPRFAVIPGDLRLAWVVVVVRRADLRDDHIGTRDLTPDLADHRDQLRHGVLRRDRIIERGRVQRPPMLSLQHPSLGNHGLDRVEDPMR